MIGAVLNQTPAANSAATGGGAGSMTRSIASIGKDQFLKLLVTQLKNQDPMSPMQPNEFAAQLAQFTSVEQLIQLNAGMTDQSAAVQISTLAGQASLGASLIGRQVVADGHQVVVPATGSAQVRVEVAGSGGTGTLTISDSTGHVVATRSLGQIAGGRQTLTLPPDLPAGTYSYAVDVKDSSNKNISVMTYTTGIVDAVHFDGGQIVLRMGGIKVLLGDVAEIETPTDSNTTTRP